MSLEDQNNADVDPWRQSKEEALEEEDGDDDEEGEAMSDNPYDDKK